jgi:5,10-methylenetetrahydromethanopterin reductase
MSILNRGARPITSTPCSDIPSRSGRATVTEIWTAAVNNTMPDIRRQAIEAEAAGFDGCFMSDSQNIRMECWVALTVAALATSKLKVGPFVTNPLTRHVAVTAGAAATLQEVSDGRVVLSIGRGDSSLANIGYGPTPVQRFETYLTRLQAYLGGEEVEFDRDDLTGVPKIEDLGYDTIPKKSRIHYLPSALPKVPVNVVASGRRVLSLGARVADEVTMVIGGDVEMLATTMENLRQVRRDAGLDPDSLAVSAMLPIAVDDDPAQALERVSQLLGEVGRWMTVQGGQPTSMDSDTESAFRQSVSGYNMTHHGPSNSPETPAVTTRLPDELLRKHGIAGPPEAVADRLRTIMSLGLKRIVVGSHAGVAERVLPLLR